jgi:sugar fermentation stimulation protein A
MKFLPLLRGRLEKRYKRFLADIVLESGERITAHVPNSGAMTSTIEAGCDVWVSHHDNPKRKLAYTLELTDVGSGLICANTAVANTLAIEAIKDGRIAELAGYQTLKPEQRYGKNSRIDILLENENETCYVEVKSVTLRIGESFAFPDAITTRGQKHLQELMAMKRAGHRAVMLFVVQRAELLPFRVAHEIDTIYATLFHEAIKAGVEVLVYQSHLSLTEATLHQSLNLS